MIVVDVETTGLDPKKHSIVSIGALDFWKPAKANQFYGECRIWKEAEITEKALEVNGFTYEQITDHSKKTESELIQEFLFWTEKCVDKTLAGENVGGFDRLFLMAALERAGIDYRFAYRSIDLHTCSYYHHLKRNIVPSSKDNRTSNLSLDRTLKYVGLPEEPKPHNALNGAKLEAEAISRLIYGKSFFEEFERYAIPEYLRTG